MNAKDVMTVPVISVTPDTTVQEIAACLLTRRISAVPVLEQNGRLVGIVSEGDLIRRIESGTEKRHSWWLRLISDPDGLAAEYVKSHARHARDVMTTDVIAVAPETSVAEIAELLESKRIKRVPVVQGGKVVGIVSRANLLQGLAAMREGAPAKADDATVRSLILDEFGREAWANTVTTNVLVTDGVVELWGTTRSEAEKKAGFVLAENVRGVKRVVDRRMVIPMQMAHD